MNARLSRRFGILALLLVAAHVQAASLSVSGFKYSDTKFETVVQVDLPMVAGVTGVDIVAGGGTPLALSVPFGATDQYVGTFGPFADLAPFLATTDGIWSVRLRFGAGEMAMYEVFVSGFGSPAADPFLPVPTITSPLDGATGVSATPTFTWDNGGTHNGAMESLFVNTWSLTGPVSQFDNSSGGLGLNDQSWTPSVVLPAGQAQFLVQYETNQDEDGRVSPLFFNAGGSTMVDPLISWDSHWGELYSRDLVTFTVVPEPASLALLTLGAAAMLRRRR